MTERSAPSSAAPAGAADRHTGREAGRLVPRVRMEKRAPAGLAKALYYAGRRRRSTGARQEVAGNARERAQFFFTEPVAGFVTLLENLDSFMETGIAPFAGFELPGLMLSGVVLLGATTLLFLRRIWIPQMRYLSLATDYFPLFLIIGIAFTGALMRYLLKVDLVSAKALTLGIVTFNLPALSVLKDIGVLFYIHFFLVCVLMAYFPFSKLTHMAGIFLSPSRNLSNNSRFVRHINPWDYPVKVHSYDAYEDEFREKMIEAGLPVEKMPESGAEGEAGSQEEATKE